MAHETDKPRRSGKAHYFTPGPAPRTERGLRRSGNHERTIPREDYFAALGSEYVQTMKTRRQQRKDRGPTILGRTD